jgi:hypothetical protein
MEQVWNESKSFEDAVVNAYSFGIKTNSRGETIEKIEQLAKDRWREVKKYVPPASYSSAFEGCQTDDYGTIIDPISLEEIPEEKLISFEENGKKWCFNIESLFEYTERGRFINPMTRNPLSDEVTKQIKKYKEEEREIVVTVRFDKEFMREYEFEMKFIRGFSYAELIVEIFRVWNIAHQSSSPELFARHVVFIGGAPVREMEKEVEESIEVVIHDVYDVNVEDAITYYSNLANALEKRPSLETFHIFAVDTYHRLFSKLSFVKSTKVLNGSGHIYWIMSPERSRNPFSFFKSVEDYFRPLDDFSGRWVSTRITEIRLDDYVEPPIPSDESLLGKRVEVLRLFSLIRLSLIAELIRTKNLVRLKKELGRLKEINLDLANDLVDMFSPEVAYGLLKRKIRPWRAKRIENPEFKRTKYYYMLLGETEETGIHMEEFVRDGSLPSNSKELTRVIALLNSVSLFKKNRDKIDYPVLYEYISENDLDEIADLLPEKRRVELLFLRGKFSGLPREKLIRYYLDYEKTNPEALALEGFQEILGDPENPLPPNETYELIMKVRNEIVFVGSVMGLAEFVFLQKEEEVELTHLPVLLRLAKENPRVAESALKTDFSTYPELVQDLYQVIGLRKSFEFYHSIDNLPRPRVTRTSLGELFDEDPEFFQTNFEYKRTLN